MATSACAETIVSADYAAPTDRYAHGILGDAIEWGALEITTDTGTRRFVLSEDRVFEDVAPRLADVDGDGSPEVIVVETLASAGAQLAVYDETGKIAATPHIGQTNRWLAPIGIADLDGDGAVEIAYIDRPHLAKTLRVWRYRDDALVPVADLPGLTNHRIGERDIGGGLRDCGDGPEMITANADWTQVMATRLIDGQLTTRSIGVHVDRGSFATALACEALP
ncbi:Repeat domain-containing protein [Yoonia rosea]|uniref:Repeat domain-containing protein n=2 Tax=Yoonia rosea TaxID=287098 RepID=A0A1R3WVX5_9RHOB|nr:VCBS repeat-containing protein [Yoonia rosea]SIT81807.1 Repeat domain-containing protein [Yoonia rosea]